MTATTSLRREHEAILAVVSCLRAACRSAQASGRIDAETFRQAIDFIRGYADAWHHAKEEEHLFPALVAMGLPREGGPVGVMLHEHELGRAYVRAMADNLEAAGGGSAAAVDAVIQNGLGYAELLEAHIQKENGILFEMADRILPAEEQTRLERVYQTAIPDGTDADSGTRFEEMAAALCERWEIDAEGVVRSQKGGCGGCSS